MVDWPDLSFVPCRRRYNDFKTDNVDGRLDYWVYNDYKALYKEILLPGQIPVSDNEYVVCIMLQDCAPQQTNILLQQLQLVARSNTNLANPPKWVFHGQLLPTGPNGKKSLEKPLSFQTRQSLQRPAMRCHADSSGSMCAVSKFCNKMPKMPCKLDKKPNRCRFRWRPGSVICNTLAAEALASHQDPHDMSQSMAPSMIAPCCPGFCRSPVVRRNSKWVQPFYRVVLWLYNKKLAQKETAWNLTQWQGTNDMIQHLKSSTNSWNHGIKSLQNKLNHQSSQSCSIVCAGWFLRGSDRSRHRGQTQNVLLRCRDCLASINRTRMVSATRLPGSDDLSKLKDASGESCFMINDDMGGCSVGRPIGR